MKAIFINHCHPETNHVCGVRAGRFAEIMAVRGHKIMLLTQTLADKDDSFPPPELERRLAAHDWRRPFQLSCLPSGDFDAGSNWLCFGPSSNMAACFLIGRLELCRIFQNWRKYFDPMWSGERSEIRIHGGCASNWPGGRIALGLAI